MVHHVTYSVWSCDLLCMVSCDLQEIKSYPVNWIKLVEKLDEGAFHRKHMFQVVITPTGPIVSDEGQTTLYLQAAVSPVNLSIDTYWSLYSGTSKKDPLKRDHNTHCTMAV